MNGARIRKSQRVEELGSEGGVAFVEYTALLLLVTVIGAVSVFGLGVPLLNMFRHAQAILSLPIP